MSEGAKGGNITVEVDILGEVYSLKSETSPEYTRTVAEHVDSMAREIRKESGVVDQRKLAVLTAIAITDQLFRMREGIERVKTAAEARAERLADEIIRRVEAVEN